MVTTLTVRDLKSRTGLDPKTIRKHLREAGVQEPMSGHFEAAAALRVLEARVDPQRRSEHLAAGRGNAAGSERPIGALAAAKAETEQLKADKMRLDVRKRQGELVERAAVIRELTSVVAQSRVALMALGSKLAPKLIGLTDALEAQRIVDDAIRGQLNALADQLMTQADALS